MNINPAAHQNQAGAPYGAPNQQWAAAGDRQQNAGGQPAVFTPPTTSASHPPASQGAAPPDVYIPGRLPTGSRPPSQTEPHPPVTNRSFDGGFSSSARTSFDHSQPPVYSRPLSQQSSGSSSSAAAAFLQTNAQKPGQPGVFQPPPAVSSGAALGQQRSSVSPTTGKPGAAISHNVSAIEQARMYLQQRKSADHLPHTSGVSSPKNAVPHLGGVASAFKPPTAAAAFAAPATQVNAQWTGPTATKSPHAAAVVHHQDTQQQTLPQLNVPKPQGIARSPSQEILSALAASNKPQKSPYSNANKVSAVQQQAAADAFELLSPQSTYTSVKSPTPSSARGYDAHISSSFGSGTPSNVHHQLNQPPAFQAAKSPQISGQLSGVLSQSFTVSPEPIQFQQQTSLGDSEFDFGASPLSGGSLNLQQQPSSSGAEHVEAVTAEFAAVGLENSFAAASVAEVAINDFQQQQEEEAAPLDPAPSSNTAQQQQNGEGKTWWGEDGYCYFDSTADGCRYYWDDAQQQWQYYMHIPAEEKPASSATPLEEHSSVTPGDAAIPSEQEQLSLHTPVEIQQSQPNGVGSLSTAPNTGLSNAFTPPVPQTSNGPSPWPTIQAVDSNNTTPWQPSNSQQQQLHYSGSSSSINSSFQQQPWQPPPAFQQQQQQGPFAQAAVYGQQQHVYQQQQGVTDPTRSPHGRPGGALGKLHFGGRLLLVTPTGQIRMHRLAAIPADINPLVAVDHESLHETHEMLSLFPGPLGPNVNKDKMMAFFDARIEACMQDEPTANAVHLTTLWSVLRVLVQYQDKLQTAHQQPTSEDARAIGAALSKALLQTSQSNAHDAENILKHLGDNSSAGAAATEIQHLLLEGKKTEALEAAMNAQLWPLALLISKLLGASYTSDCVTRYVNSTLSTSSPLRTLCLLAGGAAQAVSQTNEQQQLVQHYNQHLAIIAANKTASDENSLVELGKLLVAANQIPAAHTAFVLAGSALQYALPPGPELFSLVGATATTGLHGFSSVPAILRTEIYSWLQTNGKPQQVPRFVSVLPYKLMHALYLADLGLINQAAQYCQSIATSFQGMGQKIPPGLLVCRSSVLELSDRLQQYAAANKISLNQGFSTGNLVTSMGKLLDRGISALMGGGGDGRSSSQAHSRSNSFAGDAVAVHTRGPSFSGSVGVSPSMTRSSSQHHMPEASNSTATPAANNGDQPKLISSLISKVTSIKNVVAPVTQGAAASSRGNEAEPENVFYYDNELKMWRERGVDHIPQQQELTPPPTMAAWQPPSTGQSEGLVPQTRGVGRYINAFSPNMQQQPAPGNSSVPLVPAPPSAAFLPATGARATPPFMPSAAQQPQYSQPGSTVGVAPSFQPAAPQFGAAHVGGHMPPQQAAPHHQQQGSFASEVMSEVEL